MPSVSPGTSEPASGEAGSDVFLCRGQFFLFFLLRNCLVGVRLSSVIPGEKPVATIEFE